MNTFSRILRLWDRHTPLEDFCTECLAGVLESDSAVFQDFIKQVLCIPESEYRIKTQRSYVFDESHRRPDLIFESDSTICFLENKVKAAEGANQLQTYKDLLLKQSNTVNKEPYLRYCSLYTDGKNGFESGFFKQFRWADVAMLLKTHRSNPLVNEFYQFLVEMKMAGNERFTSEDVTGLKVFNDVRSKVNEVFSSVSKKFDGLGLSTTRNGINLTSQINDYGRFAIWAENVLGDNNSKSELLVAFQFKGIDIDDPSIVVHIWVRETNTEFTNIIRVPLEVFGAKKLKAADGIQIYFEKPLSEFLEDENQMREIEGWISDKMDECFRIIKSVENMK